MHPHRVLVPLALCAAIAGAGACSDGTTALHQARGTTSVYLTDAPMPFDSIARVDLYIVSIAASPDADTSGAGTWVTMAEPHHAYNLLDLRGGRTALAGAARIPAGDYRAVRVVIDTDSSSIIGIDGARRAIDWQTSAGRPALYAAVEHPVSVPDDGGSIVIDFDAGRSFRCGVEGCPPFLFTPVFRAVDATATGSISGTVTGPVGTSRQPLAGAMVAAYRAISDPPGAAALPAATVATTDADGRYTIPFVAPGTYVLVAQSPPGLSLAPAQRTGVVVTAGVETAGQDLALGEAIAPAALAVTPESTSVEVGGTVQLTAQADDANGNPIYVPVQWSVDRSAIASVDTGGTVRGLAVGSATITATAGPATAHAVVVVR